MFLGVFYLLFRLAWSLSLCIHDKKNQKGISETNSKTPQKYSRLSSRGHREYRVRMTFLVSVSTKLKIQTWRWGHVCIFSFILTDTRNVIHTLYSLCPLDESREYFLCVSLLVLLALICISFCLYYIHTYIYI